VREVNGARPFSSQAELVCAGAVFLVALVVYSWTLAPAVTLTDSGELIVAAYGLGVAHPPGTPLWVMLAHLASLCRSETLPCESIFRPLFSLRSPAQCLLSSWLITRYGFLFCRTRRRNKAARHGNIESSNVDGLLIFAPAVGAGLLWRSPARFGICPTITEVYTLNAFLGSRLLFGHSVAAAMIEMRTDSSAAVATHDTWMYAAAFVFGLAMGCSSRDCGVNASGHCRSRLQD